MADPFTKAEIKAGEKAHAESLADAKAHADSTVKPSLNNPAGSGGVPDVPGTKPSSQPTPAKGGVASPSDIPGDAKFVDSNPELTREADAVHDKSVEAANAHTALINKVTAAHKEKKKSDLVLEEIQECLRENGGSETGMPLSSKYWGLQNNYRQLVREGN